MGLLWLREGAWEERGGEGGGEEGKGGLEWMEGSFRWWMWLDEFFCFFGRSLLGKWVNLRLVAAACMD